MNSGISSRALYARLLGQVRPYWHIFAISIAATVLLAVSDPLIPALLKPLLDGSFVEKDPTTIRVMPLLLIGLFVLRGVLHYVSSVAMTWVSSRVVMDLRALIFHKILSLPTTYFDTHTTGTLMSKVTYNVDQLTQAATNVLVTLVRDSLAIVGLLAWMFYLNWKLSLIFFLVVPAAGLVIRVVSQRLRNASRALQGTMGKMTEILEESIGGNKVVKIFGGQDYERERFGTVTNGVRRQVMRIVRTSAASVPIVELIAVIALAAIVYIAATQSTEDQFTVGAFVSFFGAMAMLFAPTKRLTKLNDQLQRGLAASETVFALIDEESEPDTGTKTLDRARGKVEFQKVDFRYPVAEGLALENIDLVIEPGETVALVGQSGSGKSTLASLVPRFYLPTSGRILIDGIDIRELRLADLRANLAYVSQDVVLFNDTVANNIAYGAVKASEEEIIAAAHAAHAMEFIEQMPDGLRAQIGENGVRLSGGQRQRLAIARALLKAAPILILDEATSALDVQSEQHVQAALETLKKGRTTIVIAHRLSTIKEADRIVVMKKGSIQEIGSHEELLARDGAYARLYQLQFRADEEESLTRQ